MNFLFLLLQQKYSKQYFVFSLFQISIKINSILIHKPWKNFIKSPEQPFSLQTYLKQKILYGKFYFNKTYNNKFQLKTKRSMPLSLLLDQNELKTPQKDQQSIEKTQNKKKNGKKTTQYTKWTRQEDILYVRFLRGNVERMKKTTFRKPYNKFRKMADYINTKDSFQCRSHHQKMIKKYSNIQGIIQNLGSKLIQKVNKKQQIDEQNQKLQFVTKSIEKSSTEENDKQTTVKVEAKNLNTSLSENNKYDIQKERKQNQSQNKNFLNSYPYDSCTANKTLLKPVNEHHHPENPYFYETNKKTYDSSSQKDLEKINNSKNLHNFQKERKLQSKEVFYQRGNSRQFFINQFYPCPYPCCNPYQHPYPYEYKVNEREMGIHMIQREYYYPPQYLDHYGIKYFPPYGFEMGYPYIRNQHENSHLSVSYPQFNEKSYFRRVTGTHQKIEQKVKLQE